MGKTFIVILVAVFIFIGVNSFFYIRIYDQQLDFQTELLTQQISNCGNTIEQNGLNFESEVNYILFSNNISLLFSDTEGKERNLKNLELFYSKYEDLINYINIYDTHNRVYRLFKDKGNNYVSDYYESQRQETLEKRDMLKEENGQYQLIIPVFHDNQVHSNIVISINYEKYINTVFDQYRLQNTLWQWLITDEGILSSSHPKNVIIHERDIEKITSDILEGNTGSMVHTINISGEPVNVISVYYPVSLIRKDFGIVFSIKSDLFLRSIILKTIIITLASLVLLILLLYIHFRVINVKSKDAGQSKVSEIFLRQMIDNLPQGLIIINPDRSIKTINKTAKKLLNIHPDDDEEALHAVGILLESTSFDDPLYEKYFGPGMAIRYHFNNYEKDLFRQEIKTSMADQELHLVVITDISSFESNRKQKIAVRQTRNILLEQSRQEIAVPLLQIKKQVTTMEQEQGNQYKDDFLKMISKSTDLLSNLINSTFDFSLADADKEVLEEIPFSLRNELNMSIDKLKPAANMKKISIITKIRNDVPDRVIGDPFLFRQVFYDLLETSLGMTMEGRILVGAETIIHHYEQLKICFQIEDTGISIPSENIGKPDKVTFIPDNDSFEDNFKETRLKLEKARRQVELLKGELSIESPSSISTNPNYGGTKYSFTLDLIPDESHKKNRDDSAITEISAVHCLILSKEEAAEEDFMSPFHEIGCTVKQRIYSLDNLNAISSYLSERKNEYQILLIHDRPEENDLVLLTYLNDHGLACEFLIFALNTDEHVNNFLQFKKYGADYYLVHPFDPHHLAEIIRHHFPEIRQESLKIPSGMQIRKDLKILFAEDNILSRKTAQSIFKKLGFEIDSVSSGIDVIEKLSHNQYDIVFMDLLMPDKDGLETSAEIRKLGFDMPIVALTAVDKEEMIKTAKMSGIDNYLTKPAKLSDIRKLLIHIFPLKK